MHIEIEDQERYHNLINLHLYPQVHLLLGQTDHYYLLQADVVVERTGNAYQWGTSARTYAIYIDGPGFILCLRAVYFEHEEATAEVELLSITPDTDAAREGCNEWVTSVLAAKAPPRDLYAEMARMPVSEADRLGRSC